MRELLYHPLTALVIGMITSYVLCTFRKKKEIEGKTKESYSKGYDYGRMVSKQEYTAELHRLTSENKKELRDVKKNFDLSKDYYKELTSDFCKDIENILCSEEHRYKFGVEYYKGKAKAYKAMNIPRSTFYRKCKRYGI